jgi:hypothetical protein
MKSLSLSLPPAMLEKGFWLYVWVVEPSTGGEKLYVGRTGDASSPNAAAPYTRFGQHLNFLKNQNALRTYLTKCGAQPETCVRMEFHALGPIFPPCATMDEHKGPRDRVAALEKKLAESLREAGYDVMNTVKSRMPLDAALWQQIKAGFQPTFPKLASLND